MHVEGNARKEKYISHLSSSNFTKLVNELDLEWRTVGMLYFSFSSFYLLIKINIF